MSTKSLIEYLIYGLIILLSLIILELVIVSPPDFTNNKSVYQGF